MSKVLNLGLTCALFLLFFAVSTFSQGSPLLHCQKDGAAEGDWLGTSVASAGDVNGDGKADFIVGAGSASPSGQTKAGSAYVYSGANCALLLYQKNGANCGDNLGWSVGGGGDVNGDGRADFIIGAPDTSCGTGTGKAFVYSGLDGNLLYEKAGAAGTKFGYAVDVIGDLNSDGKSEFIVGAPQNNPGTGGIGSTYVYSGLNGNLLYQHHASFNSFSGLKDTLYGFSVAGTGDINNDGKPDYIVGSPNSRVNHLFKRGRAFVYSGANGSTLYVIAGDDQNGHFGYSVDGGDINADGKADFIVGAPWRDAGGLTNSGSAFVYSGLDASLLYQKDGAVAWDNFGSSVAVAGKVNGDLNGDFIVGAPSAPNAFTNYGSAYLYSGSNGSLLFQKDGVYTADQVGWSVNGAGDINADGYSEIIIGAPTAAPGGIAFSGSAFVYGYDLTPPSVTVITPSDGGEYASIPCPYFTIEWTATDNVGVTGIEIWLDRTNNGTFEQLIATFNGNPGSYDWDAGPPASTTAKIKVIASDAAGNSGSDVSDNTFIIGNFCFVKPVVILPTFDLDQNYPNPFNANTNISFSLDQEERVDLVVYNILGEKVRTLVAESRSAGAHEVAFDGRDDKGRTLSSGTYFYKLTAGERVVTKQMVLVK